MHTSAQSPTRFREIISDFIHECDVLWVFSVLEVNVFRINVKKPNRKKWKKQNGIAVERKPKQRQVLYGFSNGSNKKRKKSEIGGLKQFFVSMDFVIETFKYGDMVVCVLNIGIY